MSFPKDGRIPKALVFSVYTTELAQTIILTRDAYADYASGFGNLNALDSVQTIWFSVPILTGIGWSTVLHYSAVTAIDILVTVSASVQTYYGYRVYLLSNSWILGVIIWVVRSLLIFVLPRVC